MIQIAANHDRWIQASARCLAIWTSAGSHFMGSYRPRNVVEFSRTRSISTSCLVAIRATKTPTTNSKIPPRSECIRVKIEPPESRATKNNRLSAPQMVRGEFIVLNTLLRRVSLCRALTLVICSCSSFEWRSWGSASRQLWKQPGHEIDCADGHADAEDDSGEHALGLSLTVGEHQSAHDDG